MPAPEGKGSISGWLGLHKEPEAAPAPAAAEAPAAPEPAKTANKSTAKTSFDRRQDFLRQGGQNFLRRRGEGRRQKSDDRSAG